jgi:hypothetical protein
MPKHKFQQSLSGGWRWFWRQGYSITSGVTLLVLLITVRILHATDNAMSLPSAIHLENFEEYPLQIFPTRWQVRADRDAASRIYQVQEVDGNRFLHAKTQDKSIQIGLTYPFTPQKLTRLRWKWRVSRLPLGGDERKAETFDSAAGVYVLFDSRLAPRVVKYVWSATVPVGSRLQNPIYWRGKTVVLQSGSTSLNEWKEETVNLYDDYKNLFGGEPGEALGIALLSSADGTKSAAEADYDDFVLLPSEK